MYGQNNSLPKNLPPGFFLLFVAFAIALQGWSVYTLHQQPWTGIQTASEADSPEVLQIVRIAPVSPAAGLFPVQEHSITLDGKQFLESLYLVAIEQGEQAITLDNTIRTEPLGIASFAAYAKYLKLQKNLHHILSNGRPVDFILGSGKRITVLPAQKTPIHAIPKIIWLLFPVHLAGLIIGVWVWMRQPQQLAAIQLGIAGVSYFGIGTIFSLLLAREFCLPADLMNLLNTGQATLLNIFCLSLILIITTFPKKLLPQFALWLISLSFLWLSLNFHFQWLEFPWHKYIFPCLFIYAFGVWGLYRQWKNAREKPLDRAAILALQLSAVIPCGLIVMFFAIPKLIGTEPFLNIVSTRLLLLLIFIGWGVGILRYRLFDVEYWWLKSLFWVIGGFLVFLIDLVAITLFQISEQYAIGLSVIVAGFLYFPVRQWVLKKIVPTENHSLPEFLPSFSSHMAGAKTQQEFEQYWSDALQQRFQPLHLASTNIALPTPAIVENGMVLQVPDLLGLQSYRLHGKRGATRLFNNADVKNSESLLTVARMASNASNARQQAIIEERQRIMHDLHDTVGAELMTLTHRVQQPEDKKAARRALSILRDTVRLSLKATPLYLKEQLVEWRVEIASRLEATNTKLDWAQPDKDAQLTPRQVLELTQILRELVSNALKHARPDMFLLRFTLGKEGLEITLTHDGDVSDPSQWKPDTGLDSLQKRCEILQGNIDYQLEATGAKKLLKIHLTLPLLI